MNIVFKHVFNCISLIHINAFKIKMNDDIKTK